MFMLLLLPTKMSCYIGKKAVKGFNRIVYGTIYNQQKARTSLFQHHLPVFHPGIPSLFVTITRR